MDYLTLLESLLEGDHDYDPDLDAGILNASRTGQPGDSGRPSSATLPKGGQSREVGPLPIKLTFEGNISAKDKADIVQSFTAVYDVISQEHWNEFFPSEVKVTERKYYSHDNSLNIDPKQKDPNSLFVIQVADALSERVATPGQSTMPAYIEVSAVEIAAVLSHRARPELLKKVQRYFDTLAYYVENGEQLTWTPIRGY